MLDKSVHRQTEFRHNNLIQCCKDDNKEDDTVESINRRKFKRSRSRHSSDQEGSVRKSQRKQLQLDPSHTYIKISKLGASLTSPDGRPIIPNSPSPIHITMRQSLATGIYTSRQSLTPFVLPQLSQQLGQQQTTSHYRRPLTPHKTQRQRQEQSRLNSGPTQAEEDLYRQLNAKDMQIMELQQQNDKLKQERDNLKRVGLAFQKQKIKLLNEKNRLESRNTVVEQQLQQKSSKLKELENVIISNQSEIKQAKSSLQKLRKVIKQNRISELENQNKKLEIDILELKKNSINLRSELDNVENHRKKLLKQNEQIREKLAKLQANIMTKEKSFQLESMRQQYLNKQLNSLKSRLEEERGTKERELEQHLEQQKLKLFQAQSIIHGLRIRIDILSRREAEVKQQAKKQSSVEYLQLKERFRKFLHEYQKFRKEHNQLKIDHAMLVRKGGERTSHPAPPYDSMDGSLDLSLDLSPQK